MANGLSKNDSNFNEKWNPLSFNEICDQIPTIRNAYRIAKMIGHRRGVPFCANQIFYDLLKPMISFHIGLGREALREYAERFPIKNIPEVFSTGELLKKLEERARQPDRPYKLCFEIASQDPGDYKNRWLESCEAYDLVYETIYEALPDCNHKGVCL